MELRYRKENRFPANSALLIRRREAHSSPLHAHDFFELEIVVECTGKQILNGKEYTFGKGNYWLLNPADFHQVLPNTDAVVWNIGFDETLIPESLLETVYGGQYKSLQLLEEDDLRRVDTAAQLLKEEHERSGTIRPLMEYLLRTVLRESPQPEQLQPVRKALLYLETHFRENPSLADIAQQACLSPEYFCSQFKQLTGMTYLQYLNQRKINCAKMLLENGLSVTETCFSAGFGSLSGFLYTFRQATGMSPSAYKNSFKNKHP